MRVDRKKRPYDVPLFEVSAEGERGAAVSREHEQERYYRLTASIWPAIEAIMRSSAGQVAGAPLVPSAMDVFEAHVSLTRTEIAVTSTDTLTGRDFTRIISDQKIWSSLVHEYTNEVAPDGTRDAFIVVVDHSDKEAGFF